MNKLINQIHELLNENEITTSEYRIELLNIDKLTHSDWTYIELNIYRPNKRKPCQYRKLAVNFVRNTIDWEKSSFNNY